MGEQIKSRYLRCIATELQWANLIIWRKFKRRVLGVKRLFVRPKLPKNPDGKVLIHLGCGDIDAPGFINVDIRPAPHVHYVRDVCDLSVFPDNYADLVYACHVLEHIPLGKLKGVLCEWKRVLKLSGTLRISVPDFDKMVAIYRACGNVESIEGPLLGVWEGYDVHCAVYNSSRLSMLIAGAGLVNIREWYPALVSHHDFEDWASRTISQNGTAFDISLNLEASKAM